MSQFTRRAGRFAAERSTATARAFVRLGRRIYVNPLYLAALVGDDEKGGAVKRRPCADPAGGSARDGAS